MDVVVIPFEGLRGTLSLLSTCAGASIKMVPRHALHAHLDLVSLITEENSTAAANRVGLVQWNGYSDYVNTSLQVEHQDNDASHESFRDY